MSLELALVCLAVGAGTYLFRYLPARWSRRARPSEALKGVSSGVFRGALGAFLGSVGIAAVAALLAASVQGLAGPAPAVDGAPGWLAPALARGAAALLGFAVTLLTFVWRRSVALATLLGAAAYGLAWWVLV